MVIGYDVKALQCDRCQAPVIMEMCKMPQFAIRDKFNAGEEETAFCLVETVCFW